MVNKIKKIKTKKGNNLNVETLIATILILLISIFSVFSAFFIFSIQSEAKTYQEEKETRYSVLNVIQKDIDKILSEDVQRQQISLTLQQDLIYLNEQIKSMKSYNLTHPNSYNQTDIDKVAIQYCAKLVILNGLIRKSYAYNWSSVGFANHDNNYTYNNTEYYLIMDLYPQLESGIDEDIKNMINETFLENETEILEIRLVNWESELFNNLYVVMDWGTYTSIYTVYAEAWITGFTYYDILDEADSYAQIQETYEQSLQIMSTSLILLTVSGVIIAFVVSIDKKIYMWITMILAAAVSIIGLYLFALSFGYLFQANIMVIWY